MWKAVPMPGPLTPCEEYGHIYKTVWDFRYKPPKIFECCDDCGDEYETSIEEL